MKLLFWIMTLCTTIIVFRAVWFLRMQNEWKAMTEYFIRVRQNEGAETYEDSIYKFRVDEGKIWDFRYWGMDEMVTNEHDLEVFYYICFLNREYKMIQQAASENKQDIFSRILTFITFTKH